MQNLSLDIEKTKALLIGVSDYLNLPIIKPAINDVKDFYSLLINPDVLGLPEKNIIQILNKSNQEIFESVLSFFEDETNINTETLIFYYAGHGYRDTSSKDLYLTGINSKGNSIKISGIPFNDIKQTIENSFIQKRIVIIDACHSGLATMGDNIDLYTDDEINIKGTYVITSSAGNEKSFFETTKRNTYFTQELLSTINNGLLTNKPFISLEDLFISLQNNLKNSRPQRKTNINASDFFLFKNVKFDKYSLIEREGDDFFDDAEYEKALSKFTYVQCYRPNDNLKLKIEKCELRIETRKELELAEKKRKLKEEEQQSKEKEELIRKREEKKIVKEKEELKRKQKEQEQQAIEQAELMRKQKEQDQQALEQAELKRKQQEEKKASKEKEELKYNQEKIKLATGKKELNRKPQKILITIALSVIVILFLWSAFGRKRNNYLDTSGIDSSVMDSVATYPILRAVSKELSEYDVNDMLKSRNFYIEVKSVSEDYGYIDFGNDQGVGAGDTFRTPYDGSLVIDDATHLVWEKTGSPVRLNYTSAIVYINDLNLNSIGGHTDWRLPTLEEALSLVTRSVNSRSLHISELFDDTQKYIWTSDTQGYSTGFNENTVWFVNFQDADTWYDVSESSKYYVRAVSSGNY